MYSKKNLFAFILTLSSVTSVFSQNQVPEQLKKFADVNDGTCAQVVPQFVSDPTYEVALKEHPISVDKICLCSRKAILEDETLKKQFSGKEEDVLQRLKFGNLKSYLLLRSTQSAFQCVAEEIDRSLKYVKLEQ